MSTVPVPANTAFTDDNGRLTQAGIQYLRDLGRAASSWAVGDYRQSAVSDLGPNWLKCDGTAFKKTDYPALEKVLAPITASTSTDTRQLPFVGPVFDSTHPGPGGPAVINWFIRAA